MAAPLGADAGFVSCVTTSRPAAMTVVFPSAPFVCTSWSWSTTAAGIGGVALVGGGERADEDAEHERRHDGGDDEQRDAAERAVHRDAGTFRAGTGGAEWDLGCGGDEHGGAAAVGELGQGGGEAALGLPADVADVEDDDLGAAGEGGGGEHDEALLGDERAERRAGLEHPPGGAEGGLGGADALEPDGHGSAAGAARARRGGARR